MTWLWDRDWTSLVAIRLGLVGNKESEGLAWPCFWKYYSICRREKTYAWPNIMPWNWQVLERVSVLCAASGALRSLRKAGLAKAILQGLWHRRSGEEVLPSGEQACSRARGMLRLKESLCEMTALMARSPA